MGFFSKRYWFRFLSFETVERCWFKVEYFPSDDCFKASMHITHRWFGGYRWHVIFLPDFIP